MKKHEAKKTRWLQLSLLLFLVFLIANCSGNKAETSSDSGDTTTPTTTTDDPNRRAAFDPALRFEITGKDDFTKAVCQQFAEALKASLELHLWRSPNEGLSILAETFPNLIESIYAEEEAEKFRRNYNTEQINSCDPYHAISDDIKTETKFKNMASRDWPDVPLDKLATLVVFWRALKVTMRGLDRLSSYDPPMPKNFVNTSVETKGFGAGIIFKVRSDYLHGRVPKYLVVEGFYPGAANSETELPIGSRIRKIDGKLVSEFKNIFEAVDKVDFFTTRVAPKNIKVVADIPKSSITIGQSATDYEEKTVTLKTGEYNRTVANITLVDRTNMIAHIRLFSFDSRRASWDVSNEFSKALQEFALTERKPIRAFILDLRGNPGGYSDQNHNIIELFLGKKATLVQRNYRIFSNGQKLWHLEPAESRDINGAQSNPALVVLVDRLSASASEVFSSTIKEYERGLIIGEPTIGKGFGQRPLELGAPLHGIAYVSNYYLFTPSGKSFFLSGVEPHEIFRDPVIDWQENKKNKKVFNFQTCSDNMSCKDTIPPYPERDVFPENELQSLEDITLVTSDIQDSLPAAEDIKLGSCSVLPDDQGDFEEELDCLYDYGLMYARLLADELRPAQ